VRGTPDDLPAVLFDAADTLIELVPTAPELLTRGWLGADGAPSAADVLATMTAMGAEGGWPDYEANPDARLAVWTEFFREALHRSGGTGSADAARRAARHALAPRNYRCYPDVRSCLARLRAAGHQTALVSNFDQWLHDILDAHGLSAFFDTVVVSAEVGVQKPDLEIFALSCARLNRRPGDCVFVGDSITVDVRGSAAAGMSPVLIDRYGRCVDFAGPRITSLDELPALLRHVHCGPTADGTGHFDQGHRP
jgi:putative hydrolase of the HAD superfamily